jgi:glycogen debranching enzyme
MFDAASYMDLRRLPEFFCGFARRERNAPTQYPVACSPQAWASATHALPAAGLARPRAPRPQPAKSRSTGRCCRISSSMHLRNLRLSGGSVDVMLHRYGDGVAATVTRRDGDVVVVVRN